MGFLDPAWEKVLSRSPHWFARDVRGWDSWVVGELRHSNVPSNGFDLCRSAIYGRLATALARLLPLWPHDDQKFVAMYAANADKVLPQRFRGMAFNIGDALWGGALLSAAYLGDPPEDQEGGPFDPRHMDRAPVIDGAKHSAAAVAGILKHVCGDRQIEVLRQETMDRDDRTYCVIQARSRPILGPDETHTFYFRLIACDPPAPIDRYLSGLTLTVL